MIVDEEFLAFVRGKPCARCQCAPPSQPHHLAGRGAKSVSRNDYVVLPVCAACHLLVDWMPMTEWTQPWKRPEIGLAEDVSALLVEYFRLKASGISTDPSAPF